jgi:hypothetical protein
MGLQRIGRGTSVVEQRVEIGRDIAAHQDQREQQGPEPEEDTVTHAGNIGCTIIRTTSRAALARVLTQINHVARMCGYSHAQGP